MAEIFVEDPQENGSSYRFSCVIESSVSGTRNLWFEVPEEFCGWVTRRADPFLVASLFQLMTDGEDVRVHGDLSAGLLEPLLGYMDIWSSWRPELCRPISISADNMLPDQDAETGDTVMLFSGGLDAQTTLQRHLRADVGDRTRTIGACVYTRGFMNGLEDSPRYRAAWENAKNSVLHFGHGKIPVIPLVSNWQELNQLTVPDSIGTGLISFLHLFKSRFARGMLSSSATTHDMVPYGSHPFADPLLGHKTFQVECDDPTSTRLDKALYLSDKPDVLERLLVCHAFDDEAQNCGKCEKCYRTALCFTVHGKPVPECIQIDWDACKRRRTESKTFRDDPESSLYISTMVRERQLGHVELVRFHKQYRNYVTKKSIQKIFSVWGLRLSRRGIRRAV